MTDLIRDLRDAGLFDFYGISVTEGQGIYMSTENGEIEVDATRLDLLFDIPSEFVTKPKDMGLEFVFAHRTPVSIQNSEYVYGNDFKEAA